MKKIIKCVSIFAFAMLMAVAAVACGKSDKKGNENSNKCSVEEKVELGSVVLSEVEFENADTVKLEQDCDEIEISVTNEKMSDSQKTVYGVEDVTHVAVVKVTFDKERTLESFVIKGNLTKVFGSDDTVENYAGTLTGLLDNESGEDAYTNLILSAHTKEYELTAKYTDGTESKLAIEITATLATAEA